MAGNVPLVLRIPVAIGLLLLAGQVAGVPGTAWATQDSWIFSAVLLGAAALCATRAVHESRERAVWALFALGMASYGLGFVYWSIFQEGELDHPFPSPADGLWLSLYPCTVGALWLLARSRLHGMNRRIWLDGLIVGLGLAAISASVVFREVAATTEGDTLAIVTTLAYPVGDLLLLIMVAAVFRTARRLADRTFQLLVLGIGLLVITDSVWFVEVAHGTYVPNGMVDLGWPAAMVLIGAAAWQPRGARGLAAGDTSITLPIVLATLCVGLLVYDHWVPMETLGVLLAAAAVVAAVLRLVLTHRASVDLLRVTQRAALTDDLTQLGNRAKLGRDLDIALEGGGRTLIAIFDLDGFKNYNDTFGHPAGDALLRRLARNLMASMPAGAEAYRMGGDEFCALIPWHGDIDVAVAVAPACTALSEQGEGFSVTTSWGHAIVPIEASTASEALRTADRRLYGDKNTGRVSARRQSQQVLKRVLEQRDHMLGIHVDDVAALAERTARALGLDDDEVERVVLTAELHDIGKSAIPDAILFKPGPLEPEEWAFMQRHTVIGERILAGAPSLMAIARAVRSSHERFDGKGYPDGLAGEAIPLAARIVLVCDAFDAMVSDRPYRSAIPAEAAVAELRDCAGTHFDPAVVDAFTNAFRRSPVGQPDGSRHRA